MTKILYTVFSKTLTLFFSLILGVIFFVTVAYYFPEQLELIQIQASQFKSWILNVMSAIGSKPAMNVWIRQLLGDEQIVFLFFVIVARIMLYLLFIGLFTVCIKPFKSKNTAHSNPHLQ